MSPTSSLAEKKIKYIFANCSLGVFSEAVNCVTVCKMTFDGLVRHLIWTSYFQTMK